MLNKLLLLLLILATACQHKTSTSEQPDSLAVDSSSLVTAGATTRIGPAIAPTTFRMGDWDQTFDILVDANGRLYKEPNPNSAIVSEVQSLTPFFIETSTQERLPDNVDSCERYFWYQVTLHNGDKVWVYGADVKMPYSYPDDNRRNIDGYQFDFNKKKYKVKLLTDSGIGPADENGQTGCSRYVTPYFYREDDNRLYFIKAFDSQLTYTTDLLMSCYPNQLAFTESGGGSSKLVAVTADDTHIHLTVGIYFQEGGGLATLHILFKDDVFELESFIFEEKK